ncbi:hypothetical protein BC830DRAFT_125299 [Chytriomyces sp. MP71]|nr:hypothetical protein BC830DRAFT_125299 [Chytriomyces sp. MP71]
MQCRRLIRYSRTKRDIVMHIVRVDRQQINAGDRLLHSRTAQTHASVRTHLVPLEVDEASYSQAQTDNVGLAYSGLSTESQRHRFPINLPIQVTSSHNRIVSTPSALILASVSRRWRALILASKYASHVDLAALLPLRRLLRIALGEGMLDSGIPLFLEAPVSRRVSPLLTRVFHLDALDVHFPAFSLAGWGAMLKAIVNGKSAHQCVCDEDDFPVLEESSRQEHICLHYVPESLRPTSSPSPPPPTTLDKSFAHIPCSRVV